MPPLCSGEHLLNIMVCWTATVAWLSGLIIQDILENVDKFGRIFYHVCLSTAMLKLGKLRYPGSDYGNVTRNERFQKLLQSIRESLSCPSVHSACC